jgi:hypothetical protein
VQAPERCQQASLEKKNKKQKKKIHRVGADKGQESALWKSEFDWHRRIVKDFIWNIKPPLSKYVFRIPVISIESRKWSSTDFPIQGRSNVPNSTISVQDSVIFSDGLLMR